jgi:hypothetical protein
MNAADLANAGWTRALWMPGPPHWMDPTGRYVRSETEALAELENPDEERPEP